MPLSPEKVKNGGVAGEMDGVAPLFIAVCSDYLCGNSRSAQ